MRASTTTLIAVAAMCLAGLWVFGTRADPRPPASAPLAAPGASPSVAEHASLLRPHAQTLREEAVPDVATEPWLQHAYTFELELLVVDATGLPVEGRQVMLAPERMQWNRIAQATGPDGTVVATWCSRQPRGVIVVCDETGTLHRVSLEHGHRRRLTLGSGWQATSRGATRWAMLRGDGVPVVTDLPIVGAPFRVPGSTPAMQAGLHPCVRFEEPSSRILPTEAQRAITGVLSRWRRAGGGARAHNLRFTPRPPQGDVGELVRSLPFGFAVYDAGSADGGSVPQPPQPIGIHGVVRGEDGLPAADIPIAVLGSGPQPLQHTVSDQRGAFAFLQLDPGTFVVRAGGGPRGIDIAACEVTEGLTAVTAHLSRDACVRGRAQTPAGAPIAEARILWRALDGSWCDETNTAADGSFVLANLPDVPGHVSAWPRNKLPLLPNAWTSAVRTDAGELLLRYDPEAGSSLQFEIVQAVAGGDRPTDVRVWQLDSGFGAMVPDPAPDKPWRLQHLPAGWYQLELFAQGSGWFDAGTHWVDGTTDIDLGRIRLPEPGTVHFAPRAGTCEICQLRADVDVRVQLAPVPFDQPVLLPAGDYVFACRPPAGRTTFQRFTVRSGETTVVAAPD